MQTVLPSYLESSLSALTRNQEQLREQMARALKGDPLGAIEEQTRRNMELFSEAMRMWMPFGGGPPVERRNGSAGDKDKIGDKDKNEEGRAEEIENLRRQIGDMQRTIETIARRK